MEKSLVTVLFTYCTYIYIIYTDILKHEYNGLHMFKYVKNLSAEFASVPYSYMSQYVYIYI